LFSAPSLFCRSIQGWLYLWAILKRQFRRQRTFSDKDSPPSATVKCILDGLSDTHSSCDNITLYSPRSPCHPTTILRSSMPHLPLVDGQNHSGAGQADNYPLRNLSATGHRSAFPQAHSSAGGLANHRCSSDAGSYHISVEPESPLSHHSAISPDNFPIPAGDVVFPGEAIVLTGRLYPTTPEWILRYERDVNIPRTESKYKIPPLQTIFPHNEPLPSEWTPLVHPEGALYFYHDDRRIFTDAYLYDPHILLHASAFIRRIDELKLAITIQPEAELVLEITPDYAGNLECGYYFVHHQTRSLFWLEEFEVEDLACGITGLSSAAHLKYQIEAQYWKHWEFFPNNYSLSQDLIDELNETLLYLIGGGSFLALS